MTAFNKYYESERDFLKDLGQEFATKNPQLAPFLSQLDDDPMVNDPDVERLLEGFAFLTGRLREKIDDELPELTHSLIELLWPHYLRPIPSLSILQFHPLNNIYTVVKKGCEVESQPIQGTSCRFKTCYDVELYPFQLEKANLNPSGNILTLSFVFEKDAQLSQFDLKTLRLFLDGRNAYLVYLWLFRHLNGVQVRAKDDYKSEGVPLEPPDNIPLVTSVGFTNDEKLFDYPSNSFAGYRLLQEYFALPEKFLFIDLNGLRPVNSLINSERSEGFDLVFHFSSPLEVVEFKKEHFRLHCTPIINLFKWDAVPITLDHRKVEYLVRPEGHLDHYEIYSIDNVQGQTSNQAKFQNYPKFENFHHAEQGQPQTYYRTRLKLSVVEKNRGDTFLEMVKKEKGKEERTEIQMALVTDKEVNSLPTEETISIELTCTNRQLLHAPNNKPGLICKPTYNTPDNPMTFANITAITPSSPPPLKAGLHWQMISNMSLNYRSLSDADALREILLNYDFAAHFSSKKMEERRSFLQAIKKIEASPLDILEKGIPKRGIKITLDLIESKFKNGAGQMYLFACVLDEFFALYASINSFHRLKVRGVERDEIYPWIKRQGQQYLNGVDINAEKSS